MPERLILDAPQSWGATFGPDEVNDETFGSVLVTLEKPKRCPRCGGNYVGTRFVVPIADATIDDPLQPAAADPDAYECGDCGFEASTAEPFEEAARTHLEAQEPPATRSPRFRHLRESIALWLAPWIIDWDDEGW